MQIPSAHLRFVQHLRVALTSFGSPVGMNPIQGDHVGYCYLSLGLFLCLFCHRLGMLEVDE